MRILARGTQFYFRIIFLLFSIIFGSATEISAQVSVTSSAGSVLNQTYPNLDSAFTFINSGRHQGIINISITANVTEAAAPVALLSSGTGSASYSRVLIKPSGGSFTITTTTPVSNKGIIELRGADNVTIDGDDPNTAGNQNLTITYGTTATTIAAVIRMGSASTTDGATNDTVRNCIITGNRPVGGVSAIYGINIADYATPTTGLAISATGNNRNIVIQNNVITRCHHGIYANGSATGLVGILKIVNNKLGDGTQAANIGSRGIYLLQYTASTSADGAIISGNDIECGDPSGTGYGSPTYGIEIGANNFGTQLYGNNIHNIRQPFTTTAQNAVGILISGAMTASGISIYNNFIRDITGSSTSTAIGTNGGSYGILISGGTTGVSLDHNTIVLRPYASITGTNPISACLGMSVAGVTASSFRNNIVVNTNSSSNAYGIYCIANSNISGGSVDYNNYYVTPGNIGFYTAAQALLSNWATATSKDGNSKNNNPSFISTTDLHVSSLPASTIESGGVLIAAIGTDYDGQTRPGPTGSVNGGGQAPDIGADEFDGYLTGCSSAPSGLTYGSVTSSSAVINWTAATIAPLSGYEYYFSTSSTAPTTSTSGSVAAGVTTVSLNSLTANTTYYVWVRSKCDATNNSAWVGPVSFTTTCTPYALNVVQGFNALAIPSCWSQQYVVGTSNLSYPTSSSNPNTTPQEGTNYVYWNSISISSGNETRLVSPPIMTTGTSSVDVQFQWFHDNTGFTSATYADEGVFVEYSTNGTTWTQVGSQITRLGGVNGWSLKTITLPAGAGNQPVIYVGFRFRSRFGNNCSMDALDIHPTPACSAQPTALNASAIGSTSASINWTAASPIPASGYEYYYSTSSTAPTTTITGAVANTVTSVSLSALTAGTTYYFWVRSRCDASTTSLWAGASTFTTIAPCSTAPTALTSSAITSSTATISWTAASPAPASGYEYYVSASATAPLSTTTPTGTVAAGITTASLSGLNASTIYYFWVRSLCSTGNASAWTTSATFTTTCGFSFVTTVASVNETFNTTSSTVSCWQTQANVSGTASTPFLVTIGTNPTTSPQEGDRMIYFNSFSISSGGQSRLISMPLNTSGATSVDVDFYWRNENNTSYTSTTEGVQVQYSTNGGTTWTNIGSFISRHDATLASGTAQWKLKNVSIGALGVGTNIRVGFLFTSQFGDNCFIDNITIKQSPACAQQPSALISSLITSNTATISWTAATPAPASGYQYYLSTSNTAPTTVTTATGTVGAGVTTANLTGLSSSSTYYFWVRSYCNATDISNWFGSSTFTTLCGNASIPWSENFDAMTTIGTSVLPNCWKIEQPSGTPWASMNASSITYNDPASAPNYITCNYSPTGGNKFLITPGFSLTANTVYNFSFQYVGDGYSGWTADFGYNTTQTGTGYTLLGAAFLSSSTISPTTYNTISQNFTPTTTGTYYFVIRVNNTLTPWYLGFDNFSVTSLASCTGIPSGGTAIANPTLGLVSSTFNLSATGYTSATGVTYQWESSSSATGPWTAITGATTLSYNATAPATINVTTYYRLKITCTASSQSGYSTVTSFTTNYCTPTFSIGCGSNDYVNDFILNTLSNVSSGCNGNPNNYILYPATGTNTTTLTQGVTYNASVNIGRGGSGNVAIWIDYNNNGTFETTERYVNTVLVPVSGTVVIPILIPVNALVGNHRLRVVEVYSTTLATLDPCVAYTYGETEDYTISVVAAAPCSGTPVPGSTIANLSSVCSGTSVNLSLQNQIAGSAITYQWQSGTSATGPWTNITSATTYTLTTAVSITTWFQCKVVCNGTATAYSTPVMVSASACVIMPATGSTTVTTCSATFFDSGGSGANYGNNESGTLILKPATLGSFISVAFNSFDIEACCDNLKIYNGNSTAAPLLGTYTSNPGTITSTAADGSLTFVFTSDFSVAYTGWDATVSCYTPPPCTGVPAPGMTRATNTFVCIGSTSVLSVANPPSGSGVTYQWQSAPDVAGVAGTYTNITAAISPTYNYTPTLATTVWYRCIVTCSGNSANSIGISLVAATCTDVLMSNGSITTCSARFYDSGGAGGNDNTSNAVGNYGNNQNFTYTFYPATAGAKITVAFSAFALESGGFDYLKIYDGNSAAALLLGTYLTNPGTITSTASDGSLTFVFVSDGSVNKSGWDAAVSCFIPPPCVGIPNAGTASTFPSTGPAGSSLTLNAVGLSAATGLTFQWQSSSSATGPWTNIAGATTIPATVTASGVSNVVSTMYYQLVVTCTNSGQSATSSVTSFITANYCTPSHTATSTYYINKISFLGTLNDVNNNSTYSTTGYQDFTGLSNLSIQAQGEGINLYVQSNLTAATKAWVDWNNDGTFDVATEQVYTSGSTYTQTTTFGFVIPVLITPGNYRIRIRTTRGGGTAFGPCGVLTDGETEDYLFTVIPTCSMNITSITDGEVCGSGPVTLSVTATAGATQYFWYAIPSGGIPIATTTVPTWTTPSIFRKTTYYVTASNGTCESIVRTAITASIADVPVLSFTPNNPIVCGEGAVLRLNATGDTEEGILFNEKFNSGLGVFTVQNILDNGVSVNAQSQWQSQTSTFVPAYTAVWHPAISSGVGPNPFAFATSDLTYTEVNTALVSPVVNTTGFLDLYLNFSIYYSHYLPDGITSVTDSVLIEASIDGGTTWSRVSYYIDDQGIGTRFSDNLIILNQFINNSNLKIRFRYHGDWADGLAIDNVKLYGYKPLTSTFSWAPINQNNLFTDSTGLTPYTGGSIPNVYIRPTLQQLDSASTLTFTATATLSNGCSASSPVSVTIVPSQWTGDVSADWHNINNWCSRVVPSPTTKVEIPAGLTRYPIISAPATAKLIIVNSGASLTVTNTGKLSVYGSLTNLGGNFDVKNGTLEIISPSTQTLAANLFVGNNLKNLIVNTDSLKLGGTLNLLNKLSFSGSNRNFFTNGFLVLKSSDTLTAYLADITNGSTVSGNKISGQVSVERFVSARRAWRLLSSPTQHDLQTIKQAWQENALTPNANPLLKYGIQITSNRSTWLSDGFDTFSVAGPSVKIYNPLTNLYDGITTTNTPFLPYKAYMSFIRGDRSITQLTQLPSSTTLREKGTLLIGNVVVPVGTLDSQFVSVGNPYASAIDFIKLDKVNIGNTFYLWDPALSTYGGYQTCLVSGNNILYTPGGGSYGALNFNIQSGQGFFVRTQGGAGTITFKEISKTDGSQLVSRATNASSQLRTNLYRLNNNNLELCDGVLAIFDANNTDLIDQNDALKFTNANENLAISKSGKLLSIESKSGLLNTDTINLKLSQLRIADYRFVIYPQQLGQLWYDAFLVDNYLGTRTPINVSDSTVLSFNVANIFGSYSPDRFYIIFKTYQSLPVKFAAVNAWRKNENSISVNWKVENESDVDHYELERSANGLNFETIQQQLPLNNNYGTVNYHYDDHAPLVKENYYRVKALCVNQQIFLSKTVMVSGVTSISQIQVVPNPITNRIIQLSCLHLTPGIYGFELHSPIGQKISEGKFPVFTTSEKVKLPVQKRLLSGVYNLIIMTPDQAKKNLQVIVR